MRLLLAYRFLRSKSNSSFINIISKISVLGIILGLSVLITVISVMIGFENELYDKVKDCILNIYEIRKTKIRNEFKKYDWTTMCPVYDKLFSSIIN